MTPLFPFNVKIKSISGGEIIVGVDAESAKDAIAKATYHPQINRSMSDAYYFEVLLDVPALQPTVETMP